MKLRTLYSINCKGLNNNNNSLMFYQSPGGGSEVCPIINTIQWGKMTYTESGTPYNWGDPDPSISTDGFDWGFDYLPNIQSLGGGLYLCASGNWITSTLPLSFSFVWQMSNDNISWIPATGVVSTTYFTGDTLDPPNGVLYIRAIVTVTDSQCPSGVSYTTLSYTI